MTRRVKTLDPSAVEASITERMEAMLSAHEPMGAENGVFLMFGRVPKSFDVRNWSGIEFWVALTAKPRQYATLFVDTQIPDNWLVWHMLAYELRQRRKANRLRFRILTPEKVT